MQVVAKLENEIFITLEGSVALTAGIAVLNKTCIACRLNKASSDFYKAKSTVDKLESRCRPCRNDQNNRNYHKDPKRVVAKQQARIKSEGEEQKASRREYNKLWRREARKDPEKKSRINKTTRTSWKKNREKYCEKKKIYNRRPDVNQKLQSKRKQRAKNDPVYALAKVLRERPRNILRSLGLKKLKSYYDYLGCTGEELSNYIESKFLPGMTWKNRGKFHGKWNIDHIIPISWAKTEAGVYLLSHYTNLQPLWFEDNQLKGNKMPWQLNPALDKDTYLAANPWLIGL